MIYITMDIFNMYNNLRPSSVVRGPHVASQHIVHINYLILIGLWLVELTFLMC